MAKNIRAFLENLTDYFLNIIVNVDNLPTGRPVNNLPSKIKNLRKFLNSYSWEQREHVSCHSFEFLHNIFY